MPYSVEIRIDDDGDLAPTCDCPFDWEPVCKHTVATLMAYAARQPVGDDQLEDAAGSAVEARIQRGMMAVQVRFVAGDPWFGTWEAWSMDQLPSRTRQWQVQIRSLAERINHCTCPD
jgi:hypothetical protein